MKKIAKNIRNFVKGLPIFARNNKDAQEIIHQTRSNDKSNRNTTHTCSELTANSTSRNHCNPLLLVTTLLSYASLNSSIREFPKVQSYNTSSLNLGKFTFLRRETNILIRRGSGRLLTPLSTSLLVVLKFALATCELAETRCDLE